MKKTIAGLTIAVLLLTSSPAAACNARCNARYKQLARRVTVLEQRAVVITDKVTFSPHDGLRETQWFVRIARYCPVYVVVASRSDYSGGVAVMLEDTPLLQAGSITLP